MRKSLLLIVLFVVNFCFAQKVAYVDSKYILSNIPEFTTAQEEIEELSKKWEQEIQDLYLDIEKMYKSYQAEKYLLPEKEKKNSRRKYYKKGKRSKRLSKKLIWPKWKIV